MENKDVIAKLIGDYERACELLNYEEIMLDKNQFLKYENQRRVLKPIADKHSEYLYYKKLIEELKVLIDNVAENEKKVYENELEKLLDKFESIKNDLAKLIKLFNAINQKIVLEIIIDKSEYSNQYSCDLLKGYVAFCKKNNLNYIIQHLTGKIMIFIEGINAKGFFQNEFGLHIFKKQGVENSCQVLIYDDYDLDNKFDENAIKIITSRASGAGGQHINTTDSAVKVIDLATGISVSVQSERSQFQNKQKAINLLKEKVEYYYDTEKNKFFDKQKKQMLKQVKKLKKKIYDYDNNMIYSCDNRIIEFKDFFNGEII